MDEGRKLAKVEHAVLILRVVPRHHALRVGGARLHTQPPQRLVQLVHVDGAVAVGVTFTEDAHDARLDRTRTAAAAAAEAAAAGRRAPLLVVGQVAHQAIKLEEVQRAVARVDIVLIEDLGGLSGRGAHAEAAERALQLVHVDPAAAVLVGRLEGRAHARVDGSPRDARLTDGRRAAIEVLEVLHERRKLREREVTRRAARVLVEHLLRAGAVHAQPQLQQRRHQLVAVDAAAAVRIEVLEGGSHVRVDEAAGAAGARRPLGRARPLRRPHRAQVLAQVAAQVAHQPGKLGQVERLVPVAIVLGHDRLRVLQAGVEAEHGEGLAQLLGIDPTRVVLIEPAEHLDDLRVDARRAAGRRAQARRGRGGVEAAARSSERRLYGGLRPHDGPELPDRPPVRVHHLKGQRRRLARRAAAERREVEGGAAELRHR